MNVKTFSARQKANVFNAYMLFYAYTFVICYICTFVTNTLSCYILIDHWQLEDSFAKGKPKVTLGPPSQTDLAWGHECSYVHGQNYGPDIVGKPGRQRGNVPETNPEVVFALGFFYLEPSVSL